MIEIVSLHIFYLATRLTEEQRCLSRLKMCRWSTAVIPRKRISGSAAPHRFSGESVPHRCHATRVSRDMLPLCCHLATTKSYPHRCHATRVSRDMLPLCCHLATTKSYPHRCHATRVSRDMLPLCCHLATTKSYPHRCHPPPPLLKASPHRCHAATYLKTPAAVVMQIFHKEAYFYKSEEYVIFSINNQYLFDY